MILKDLSVGYHHKALIEDANVEISRGKLTALLGRNGTGKSTLLRVLAGLDKPLSGEVIIEGSNLQQMSPLQRAKTISFVGTSRVRMPNLMVSNVVALGRAPYTNWLGNLQQDDKEIVEKSLALVNMERYASRQLDSLSDGECQRVMIARALAQDTPVILLDEPTSFLDLPNRYQLCRLLSRLAHEQDKAILFSTHELDIALNICDSIALINPPRLLEDSAKSQMIQDTISRLFQI